MIELVDGLPEFAYENRVVAFIDILGFRELVSLSAMHPETAQHIYSFIQEIQSGSLGGSMYGSIPTFGFDGSKELKPARELESASRLIKAMKKDWPIEITQFSDSLVLSCKADDGSTCVLMLEFIAKLMRASFELGFILRGGITLGPLIHEEAGPLFGPAFVEAYSLESKLAVWPRILVDQGVVDLVVSAEEKLPNSKPFFVLFTEAEVLQNQTPAQRELKQMTLANAICYRERLVASKLDKAKLLEKIKALAQSYSSEEKVYAKYASLLQDWIKVFPGEDLGTSTGLT